MYCEFPGGLLTLSSLDREKAENIIINWDAKWNEWEREVTKKHSHAIGN
jgi:uncharacterized protein YfeS